MSTEPNKILGEKRSFAHFIRKSGLTYFKQKSRKKFSTLGKKSLIYPFGVTSLCGVSRTVDTIENSGTIEYSEAEDLLLGLGIVSIDGFGGMDPERARKLAPILAAEADRHYKLAESAGLLD